MSSSSSSSSPSKPVVDDNDDDDDIDDKEVRDGKKKASSNHAKHESTDSTTTNHKYAECMVELDGLKRDIDNFAGEIAIDADSAVSESKEARHQREQDEKFVANLRENERRTRCELVHAQDELKRSEAACELARAATEQAQTDVTEITNHINELTRHANAIQADLVNAERQLAAATDALANARAALQEAETALNNAQREAAAAESALATLEGQLRALEEALEQSNSRLADATAVAANAREELNTAEKNHRTARADEESAECALEEAETDLSDARTAVIEAENEEKAAQEAENNASKAETEALKNLSKAQADVERAENALVQATNDADTLELNARQQRRAADELSKATKVVTKSYIFGVATLDKSVPDTDARRRGQDKRDEADRNELHAKHKRNDIAVMTSHLNGVRDKLIMLMGKHGKRVLDSEQAAEKRRAARAHVAKQRKLVSRQTSNAEKLRRLFSATQRRTRERAGDLARCKTALDGALLTTSQLQSQISQQNQLVNGKKNDVRSATVSLTNQRQARDAAANAVQRAETAHDTASTRYNDCRAMGAEAMRKLDNATVRLETANDAHKDAKSRLAGAAARVRERVRELESVADTTRSNAMQCREDVERVARSLSERKVNDLQDAQRKRAKIGS
jgi:chromosome segregation ATPase